MQPDEAKQLERQEVEYLNAIRAALRVGATRYLVMQEDAENDVDSLLSFEEEEQCVITMGAQGHH